MIILTGANGFIGSVMLGYLNKKGRNDVVIVDDMHSYEKFKNIANKHYLHNHYSLSAIEEYDDVECVIHMGANANTLEKDWNRIHQENILSTLSWNDFCQQRQIPFIFTSTAAVYGNGQGPMNLYAKSKLECEKQINAVVLRLFNVYGPNEYHKGRMASTIFHWFNQIQEDGKIKLFRDSRFYRRDFVWVEDVCKTVYHFVYNFQPGIYDLGTGFSKDFETVADLISSNLRKGSKNFIEMPKDLEQQYQTDTRADISNLKNAGVDVANFITIEKGIPEYLEYLKINSRY